MRILIIGGTHFVGRHLVSAARREGHQVTVLHRGVTCSGAPGAEHLHADRDEDLGVLAGREWDATVDVCAYWPRQVEVLARELGERGGRHALISTVSVFDELPGPGLDEGSPLLAPLGLDGDRPTITGATYGRLKAGCEHVASQHYAGELLVIRPTYIVGPHDPTGRFPHWVQRLARGGTVLCPGSPDAPFQYIDVRDLADFTLRLLDSGDDGTFNVVAPPPPYSFADLLADVCSAVAPAGTRLQWVPSGWLVERGVGPRALPLWSGSDDPSWVLALDPALATDDGLRARPVGESARDTLAWLREPGHSADPSSARLSRQQEAELLTEWAADR